MRIFGCDPGASGGVAMIDGDVVEAAPTPLNDENQINIRALFLWLDARHLYPSDTVYVENVHSMPGQGVASSFQFGRNVGKLEGVLSSVGFIVKYVTPQAWKKKTLIADNVYMGMDLEDKAKRKVVQKKAAIAWAQNKFPGVPLIPEGCRVASDGMAESLCIAYYGYLVETSK